MQLIKEIFDRKIDRKIEEVIKIDQHDEETVKQEIVEYVLTDAIKEHFYTIYDTVLEYSRQPHEGIRVWVSGFFGSGKSSYAKLLGYTLANLPIAGKPTSDHFIENARDSKISNYLKNINSRYKINSVIFDISMDRGVKTANDRITEVMYKVLLRQLDYPEDFDLAEMEITLENENQLDAFKTKYTEKYKKDWAKGKKIITNALNETSNILHEMFPEKYNTPDSWLLSIGKEGRADIDPNKLSRLTFELIEKRKPGQGIIYIIDEVGQYVARSTEKMLDLQAIVQALGKESKNRVKANKAAIPAWVIVTSQEKLEEVVDALDARRIELARLQDRFPIPIDLKQSDIKEVTSKRVLEKNKQAIPILGKLYDEYEGRLKTHTTLERTHRNTSFSKDEFIELYPYLPYQIELSINIVAGLRSKRGAQRHVGGSNRTIIKQAQQMLIHPQTNLAEQPLGTLVTLDKIYELLYGGSLLPIEITQEIDTIRIHLDNDEMALKVAKVISLLEVVRDLPKTVHNIAVVLHNSVSADSLENDVEKAIKRLKEAQFIRESEEGYKLLTVQEKNWDTERRSKQPKERNKLDIIEEFSKSIFSEPALRTYRYKNLTTFRMGVNINDRTIADGTIDFNLYFTDEPKNLEDLKKDIRKRSRELENEIFWIFSLTDEIHNVVTELYRSRSMIQDYSRLQSQSQITREEMACLEDERQAEQRLTPKFKTLLSKSIESGCALFRGIEKDGSLLGNRLSEIMKSVLTTWIPDIYPKLELGARNMTGKEPELILSSSNLKALPALFYDSDNGLNLITKQGDKYHPNTNAPVAHEIFQFLKTEYDYGNSVTGKILENHFNKSPYGWERDLIRLVLATLFRAGILEITSQGQKYKSYSEPNSRIPLLNQTTFRSATFAPKETVGIKTLTTAAKYFENIFGLEVDVEEPVIAREFQKMAQSDLDNLKEILNTIILNKLPGQQELSDFKANLEAIRNSASDDCVRLLAGSGATYQEHHIFLQKLNNVFTKDNILILQNGLKANHLLWPILKEQGVDNGLEEKVSQLEELYCSVAIYDQVETIRINSEDIFKSYKTLYKKVHDERTEKFVNAIETVKGHQNFANLSDAEQEMLINSFSKRICKKLELKWEGLCTNCNASFQQMESDILSVDGLINSALKKILELTTEEEEKIIAISLKQYFKGEYQSIDEFNLELEKLKIEIEKYILEGKKVFFQ